MIESTTGDMVSRSERSFRAPLLEQVVMATPIYLFVQGLRAAIRHRRR